MLLNCGIGEDSWEILGLQGNPTSPSKGDQSWVFIGRSDVDAEIPIIWSPDAKNRLIWKDPDAGKDLRAGREGDVRGWDGWMASPTQWTWVWINSGSWWWTGRPGVLQSMGFTKSQTQLSDWTERNWSKLWWWHDWLYDLECSSRSWMANFPKIFKEPSKP